MATEMADMKIGSSGVSVQFIKVPFCVYLHWITLGNLQHPKSGHRTTTQICTRNYSPSILIWLLYFHTNTFKQYS